MKNFESRLRALTIAPPNEHYVDKGLRLVRTADLEPRQYLWAVAAALAASVTLNIVQWAWTTQKSAPEPAMIVDFPAATAQPARAVVTGSHIPGLRNSDWSASNAVGSGGEG